MAQQTEEFKDQFGVPGVDVENNPSLNNSYDPYSGIDMNPNKISGSLCQKIEVRQLMQMVGGQVIGTDDNFYDGDNNPFSLTYQCNTDGYNIDFSRRNADGTPHGSTGFTSYNGEWQLNLSEVRAVCGDGSKVTLAKVRAPYTHLKYPQDFRFYDGVSACSASIGKYSTNYYSFDSDKRPSLGLFTFDEDNLNSDNIEANIKDFPQYPLTNFVNNGDGRLVRSLFDYNDTLQNNRNPGSLMNVQSASGYYRQYLPEGNWNYVNMRGMKYSVESTITPAREHSGMFTNGTYVYNHSNMYNQDHKVVLISDDNPSIGVIDDWLSVQGDHEKYKNHQEPSNVKYTNPDGAHMNIESDFAYGYMGGVVALNHYYHYLDFDEDSDGETDRWGIEFDLPINCSQYGGWTDDGDPFGTNLTCENTDGIGGGLYGCVWGTMPNDTINAEVNGIPLCRCPELDDVPEPPEEGWLGEIKMDIIAVQAYQPDGYANDDNQNHIVEVLVQSNHRYKEFMYPNFEGFVPDFPCPTLYGDYETEPPPAGSPWIPGIYEATYIRTALPPNTGFEYMDYYWPESWDPSDPNGGADGDVPYNNKTRHWDFSSDRDGIDNSVPDGEQNPRNPYRVKIEGTVHWDGTYMLDTMTEIPAVSWDTADSNIGRQNLRYILGQIRVDEYDSTTHPNGPAGIQLRMGGHEDLSARLNDHDLPIPIWHSGEDVSAKTHDSMSLSGYFEGQANKIGTITITSEDYDVGALPDPTLPPDPELDHTLPQCTDMRLEEAAFTMEMNDPFEGNWKYTPFLSWNENGDPNVNRRYFEQEIFWDEDNIWENGTWTHKYAFAGWEHYDFPYPYRMKASETTEHPRTVKLNSDNPAEPSTLNFDPLCFVTDDVNSDSVGGGFSQFARWIMGNTECYSHGKCLQLSASRGYWEDDARTSTLIKKPMYEAKGDWDVENYAEVTVNTKSQPYTRLNQTQKILDEGEATDVLIPRSSLKVSFRMKTVRKNWRDQIDAPLTDFPEVEVGIDPSSSTYWWQGWDIQDTEWYPLNPHQYTPVGLMSNYEKHYRGAGSIRTKNDAMNTWEQKEFIFHMTDDYSVTRGKRKGIKRMYLVIQYGNNNYGEILIDDIKVTESHAFLPDVDVRVKKGPNEFGVGSLTEYYDPTIPEQTQAYEDNKAPLEAQFYFYPRHDSVHPFSYSLIGNFQHWKEVIFDDFAKGLFYVWNVDWGDGSIAEFKSKPKQIGPNKSVYHTYERSGIYEVTGYMFKVKPDRNIEDNEVDYEKNVGVIYNKKFTLRICVNEGVDEDYPFFGSENGFSFYPYKDTLPIIGGYSKNSSYYKFIKRQLGFIDDDTKVTIPFKNIGDKLKTELTLLSMDSSVSDDMEVVPEFQIERTSEPYGEGNLVYSGVKINKEELGSQIGRVDLTNIKYFNEPKPISEMIGFPNGPGDFVGIIGIYNDGMWTWGAGPLDDYNLFQWGGLEDDVNVFPSGTGVSSLTACAKTFGGNNHWETGDYIMLHHQLNPEQTGYVTDSEGREWMTFACIRSENTQMNDYGNPSHPKYWKNIIPENYSIFDREGINLQLNEPINTKVQQEWLPYTDENDNLIYPYYPVLPNYDRFGQYNKINDELDYPYNNVPYPIEGPITQENHSEQTLQFNIGSEGVETNVIYDFTGNGNYGLMISDYKPKFDEKTNRPSKIKSVSSIKSTTADGAF